MKILVNKFDSQPTPEKLFNYWNWKLELLKVKDKTASVNPEVENSIVTLPAQMTEHFFSDIFVDFNNNGGYHRFNGIVFLGLIRLRVLSP